MKLSRTYNEIYDKLEDRLDIVGPITTKEAWKVAGYSYSTFAKVFKDIIDTMIKLGKARMTGWGKYEILKPNTPKLNESKRLLDSPGTDHTISRIDAASKVCA